MATLNITTCPMCGSKRIRKVRKSVKRTVKGVTWSVPGVTFHECPACGERLFSPEAVRKIQSCAPALPTSRAS